MRHVQPHPDKSRARARRGVSTANLIGAMVIGGALTAGILVTNTLIGSANSITSQAQVEQVAQTLRMASLTTQTPLYSVSTGPQLQMASNTLTPASTPAQSDAATFTLGGKSFELPSDTAVTVVDHDTLHIHTADGVVETQFDNDAVGGWFEPVSNPTQ